MADVRLRVNDEFLDMSQSEKIASIFQTQNFSDLSEKVGGYTRSFVVPNTDRNRRILENSSVFIYNSEFPYRINPAVLIVEGLEVTSGNVIIEDNGASTREIRLTFYTGASPFFQKISNQKLRRICIEGSEQIYNFENIFLKRAAEEICYPIIDYSEDGFYINTTNDRVYFERLLPATSWAKVFEGIEDYTGYKFIGDIVNSDDLKKIIFPTSEEFGRDINYAARNTWVTTNNDVNEIFFASGPSVILFSNQLISAEGLDGAGLIATGEKPCDYTIVPQVVTPNEFGYFMFCDRVRVHMKLSFTFTPERPFGFPFFGIGFFFYEDDLSPVRKEWFEDDYNLNNNDEKFGVPINTTMQVSNGTTTYSGFPFNPQVGFESFVVQNIPFDQINTPTHSCVLEFDFDAIPHTRYFMELFGQCNILNWTNLVWEVTYVRDNNTSKEDRRIELLNYNPRQWTKSILTSVAPLPDITIGAFLKSVAQMFGALFIVNDNTREVEIFSIKKLKENIPFSLDWSSKVVNIDKAFWTTRAKGYAQSSVFKYTNEDSLNNTSIGQYTMPVADATLPLETTIVNVPYSGSEMRKGFLQTEDMPMMKRFVSSEASFTLQEWRDNVKAYNAGKQRVLYLLTRPNQGFTLNYRNNTNAGLPLYSINTTSDVPYCYFNFNNKNQVQGVTRQLGFDAYMFDEYYRFLEQITEQYRQLTLQLYLEASDIKKLDFRLPVYLSQFNSYFFIEQISDWVSGEPCKVILLKID
jgi:hypothetical protein